MTDNEKAAIAANLADEQTPESGCPDMHLPENLWRALENLINRNILADFDPQFGVELDARRVPFRDRNPDDGPVLGPHVQAESMFAALVALYDAEHPDELVPQVTKP